MARQILIRQLQGLLEQAKQHRYIHWLIGLPLPVRVALGLIVFPFSFLAFVTPIPFATGFLVLSLMLFFGINAAIRILFRLIYFLRIHILYGHIYVWLHNRKNKNNQP